MPPMDHVTSEEAGVREPAWVDGCEEAPDLAIRGAHGSHLFAMLSVFSG